VEIHKSPEEQFVSALQEKARELIRERFENPSRPENQLAFHGIAHTESVVRRTEIILRALQRTTAHMVTERDILVGTAAATFHDIVQQWDEEQKDGKIKMVRRSGKNEADSADEGIRLVQGLAEECGMKSFSDEECLVFREAILGTVAEFRDGQVIQSNITDRSGYIAKALALADLGTVGMDGARDFIAEGNALFREENLDVMRTAKNLIESSDEDRESYRQRMLGWTNFQISFAMSRKNLFEIEIQGLTDSSRTALRVLFNKFDESIEAAQSLADKRSEMSFDELLADMGFPRQSGIRGLVGGK
jgi:hypothetical protein